MKAETGTKKAGNLSPDEVLAAFGAFIHEKFKEHFQLNVKVESDGGKQDDDDVFWMRPLEISENSSSSVPERIRLPKDPRQPDSAGREQNPPFHLQATLMLTFATDRLGYGVGLLMRLKQLLHEYRSFAAGAETIPFMLLGNYSLQEQIRLWQNLNQRFKPALFCRLSLELQPIRTWETKLAREKVIHTQIKEA